MEYMIPFFLKIFIFIMFLQISITFGLLLEARRLTRSGIWNAVFVGNFFCVLITLTHALLLYKIYNIAVSSYSILLIFTIFYILTHFLVNIALHGIITPITGGMMKILKLRYIILYVSSLMLAGLVSNEIFYLLRFPKVSDFVFLYMYIFLSIAIFSFFIYFIFRISFSYRNIGFIYKPYAVAGFGGIALIISVFFILFCFHAYIEKELQPEFFYYIFFYLMSYLFSIAFYMRFVIDYPSLLQPKWKALMPFDLPKVTAAITLAFLAVSLYFTAKEYPNFIIYQNIPYLFVIALLLPLFLGIILTFTYLKTIASRTKLRYWGYLSHGLYIHLTITFYVFSLSFLSWNNATSSTKILFAIFGLASFAFYMFFALDLHTILKDQNIKPVFDRLDISRYIVSLYSWFFLILFGISFTYGKRFEVIVDLVSYPVILLFIALIAFITYLRVTHKGFEEIIRKNIWAELTYVSALIAFLLVYLIYSSLNTYIQRFPYHDFFFIGYFLVLVIEIASIRTLGLESKYKKRGEEDIVHLLNSHAHNFLRTDYLEDLWEKTVDRYVPEDEVTGIRFDPSGRRFDLEKADEHTRLKIAVAILLGMHKLPDMEKIAIMKKSIEETKEEIADILKEKVLMLPEDLRCEFDESVYYPILYEKVVNNLLKQLKAFIPFSEQEKIFERLKRRDELFKRIGFEVEEIRIKEGTKFSRDEFLKLFRFYLESLEEKFPFKRFLLYELVREEIKKELEPYDISVSDLLDIVPTGLEEMDEIMAGGLSKGSSTLLIAEETKTKHKVLLSFIEQGLKESNIVIYATSRHPFQEIIGELRVDFKDLKNFAIIDLYENIHSEERVYELVEKEHRIIVPLNKILFQRSIVKTIKSQPKEVPKIVVIDVYDDFSRYYSPGEILELLQKQIEGLKRWNCTSVIALDPYSYLIRKKGVEEVKKNFDNVMILSGDDKDASVFIEKLYHGTPSKHIIRLQ